jgi:hypothetical protein
MTNRHDYHGHLRYARLGAGLLLFLCLTACGGPDEAAVEAWIDEAWVAVPVTDYSIDGERDGSTTTAVAILTLGDGVHLRMELQVSYNPQPILSSGRWYSDSTMPEEGTMVERSMKFFGGQGEGPSLGGRFQLNQDNQPRFRIVLPLQTVSQPKY